MRRQGRQAEGPAAAARLWCQTSEALREEQGHHEVADEQDRHDETGDILGTHSRSTPLTISAATAKNATVTTMNRKSCINNLLDGWPGLTTRRVLSATKP